MLNTAEDRFTAIIVGAGAPGITAAFFLAKEGHGVVFVEKGASSDDNLFGGQTHGYLRNRRLPGFWNEANAERPVSREMITLLNGKRSISLDCPQVDWIAPPYHFKAECTRAEDRDIFLVGGTPRGKSITTLIAARLDAGFHGECENFLFDGNLAFPLLQRWISAGSAVQRVICTAHPQMGRADHHLLQLAASGNAVSKKVADLYSGCSYHGPGGGKIRPDLYIAVGVSRRTCGSNRVQDTEPSCAVMRNETFSAHGTPDYGIIGGLYGVFPMLINELRRNSEN